MNESSKAVATGKQAKCRRDNQATRARCRWANLRASFVFKPSASTKDERCARAQCAQTRACERRARTQDANVDNRLRSGSDVDSDGGSSDGGRCCERDDDGDDDDGDDDRSIDCESWRQVASAAAPPSSLSSRARATQPVLCFGGGRALVELRASACASTSNRALALHNRRAATLIVANESSGITKNFAYA